MLFFTYGREGKESDQGLQQAPSDDPGGPFHTAGFEPGDTLKVEAEGAGRVVLTRVDELIDRYSGCLDTGGDLRERVEGLREEWR